MLIPVGLDGFAARFPDRVFDVGIAEQHAVTMASGLAFGGLHPVVAVYATFLNRAFDQLLMDCALHRAGVTFVLDRAGVTGSDGASHNGMWDMAIGSIVPGLRLAAPRDGDQVRRQLREAVDVSDGPTVLRFPKGDVAEPIAALRAVGEPGRPPRPGHRPGRPAAGRGRLDGVHGGRRRREARGAGPQRPRRRPAMGPAGQRRPRRGGPRRRGGGGGRGQPGRPAASARP